MNKIYAFMLAFIIPLNVSSEELFIYNWSDYIAEDTSANFEAGRQH